MKSIAVQLTLVLLIPYFLSGTEQQKDKIKVFEFAEQAPQGFVSPASKAIEDSITDLKKSLAKKRIIGVINNAETADVKLEVMRRAHETTGSASTSVEWGTLKTRADTAAALRVRLIVGDYSEELFAQTTPEHIFGAWGAVAGDIAGQVEQWVKMNYDKLIEARSKASQTQPGKAPQS